LVQQPSSFTAEVQTNHAPAPSSTLVPRQVRSADVQAFVQRIPRLPSLPQNPDGTIDAVSAIIRKDQSLASRVLRLANSVFYALPTEISTLDQAVQLIGLHEIQNLVLATSVIKAFDRLPTRVVDVASFWRHSIACGLASALLADRRHDPLPERFFVGGLLHDIGRLVLFLNRTAEAVEVLRRTESESRLSHELERELLGFDHALLGAELLTFWKLPHSLGEMVGGHHDEFRPPGSSTDAFHIHYADFIVSLLELGTSGEVFVPPLVVPSNCHRFLLDEENIPTLVEELDIQCEEIFPILATRES
jgi:HD-like signal output (HDOD) protein